MAKYPKIDQPRSNFRDQCPLKSFNNRLDGRTGAVVTGGTGRKCGGIVSATLILLVDESTVSVFLSDQKRFS